MCKIERLVFVCSIKAGIFMRFSFNLIGQPQNCGVGHALERNKTFYIESKKDKSITKINSQFSNSIL